MKTLSSFSVFFTSFFLLFFSSANASPNGPFVTPTQNISLSSYMSYEVLTDNLFKIQARSKGNMLVESAAISGQGRNVWLVKIGDPSKTPVMIITQQHGDEPHGTEAMLDIIKLLGNGKGKAAKDILSELYVLVVPRVNVDGATFPLRGNADFSAPLPDTRGCFASDGSIIPSRLDQGRGVYTTRQQFDDGTVDYSYDMNRYHWPDWSQSWQILCNPGLTGVHFNPAANPVPEAQGVLDAYNRYQPAWVVDVHNQGFNVVNENDTSGANRPGRRVTGSILWPTNEDVSEAAVNLSKQLTLVMKMRSLQIGHMEITRYDGGTFPGIARNAYGLIANDRIAAGETNVGGSVLVEIMGQIDGSPSINIGQKAVGMLNNNVREMIMAALEATADGSLYNLDPNLVDQLILDNDSNQPNPHVD